MGEVRQGRRSRSTDLVIPQVEGGELGEVRQGRRSRSTDLVAPQVKGGELGEGRQGCSSRITDLVSLQVEGGELGQLPEPFRQGLHRFLELINPWLVLQILAPLVH